MTSDDSAAAVRARVSSTGVLYPCLFAPPGVDLSIPLRSGADLRLVNADFWQTRRDRYSELRAVASSRLLRPEMSALGG